MYKVGYCPDCKKKMIFNTDEYIENCYYCGKNVILKNFPENNTNIISKTSAEKIKEKALRKLISYSN